MKKFIVKFFLLIALVSSIVGILNFFYTRTNFWRGAPEKSAPLKFKNVPDHIELANVGSSHGYWGFDFSEHPYRSFNFALVEQYFQYDYAILRQYVTKFDKNAVLLIPISYFQIMKIRTDFEAQKPRYYSFLTKKFMDSWTINEKLHSLLPPLLTAGYNLKFIINDQPPIADMFFTTIEEQDLIENCIKLHEVFTTDSYYGIESGEEGFAWNKYWASLILDFCYAHDIQPVLISFPVISILNNIYTEETPDFFDIFYRFTRELQESYPSLPFFDYSHDPRFTDDHSLFFDSIHLNATGTKKFSATVILDLQANGLLH